MNHEQLVLKAVLTARKYNKQLNKEVTQFLVGGVVKPSVQPKGGEST